MPIQLACLNCSNLLFEDQGELICRVCHSHWPIVDGIPRFIQDSYYWGEIPQELMGLINQESRSRDWREVLKDRLQPAYAEIYHYVMDPKRAAFSIHTGIDKNSTVLDVGSGWGAIAARLAERAGRVISVESVTERVEFQKIRAEQDQLDNLYPVQASFLNLPMCDEYLDLVVLNGVLEWIGIASDHARPEALQEQVLEKIHHSLKPGGTLYIGIENRFAYPYFFGAKDHSDLPFTSLVPRKVADFTMRVTSQRSDRTKQAAGEYRTYTYSYWGYNSLLKKMGFSDINFFLAFPDYNHPDYIIPANDHHEFHEMVNKIYPKRPFQRLGLQAAVNVAAPLGLLKFFSPYFLIFAKKR